MIAGGSCDHRKKRGGFLCSAGDWSAGSEILAVINQIWVQKSTGALPNLGNAVPGAQADPGQCAQELRGALLLPEQNVLWVPGVLPLPGWKYREGEGRKELQSCCLGLFA